MSKRPGIEELIEAAERGNSGAQYNLGVSYLRGDGVEPDATLARHWIDRAANAGMAAAQSALGYLHLRAHGAGYDPATAVSLFRLASEQGFSEAIYRYAETLATGLGCKQDAQAARTEFVRAAHDGHPLAQGQLAYCLDEGIGGPADPVQATAWWFRAAGQGDGRAAAAIAERYRRGHTLAPDSGQALCWFLRAQAAGYPGAAVAVAEIKAQFDPDEAEKAQAQARMPPASEAADPGRIVERAPVEAKVICERPRVQQLANLLSCEECWHLIALSLPHLHPSQVLSSTSGAVVSAAGRRSGGMSIIEPLRDVVVWNIERRLAAAAGLPLENGEPLAILSYTPGDEYRPHYDFFDPDIPGQATALERGGQRLVTILMYLCDVAEGGETVFPNAGVSVQARRGTGVLFHNCLPGGAIDRSSRHAGSPVRAGHKWLATRWIREREFQVPGSDQVARGQGPDSPAS